MKRLLMDLLQAFLSTVGGSKTTDDAEQFDPIGQQAKHRYGYDCVATRSAVLNNPDGDPRDEL